MGYRFEGFFSDGNEAIRDAALARWPFCTAKAIKSPFRGFGMRAPDPEQVAESDDDYERMSELSFAVVQELPEFSKRFPNAAFVFIRADCFGGVCIYDGFATRAGEILFHVEPKRAGWESLQELLRPLCVRLKFGYFRPFVRGYWDES